MIRRLSEVPVSRSARIALMVVTFLVAGFVLAANNLGYFGPINGWLQAHLPLWVAVTVVILLALVPFFAFQFPSGSVADYLIDAGWVILFSVALPCLRQVPFYLQCSWLPGFLYFMIRTSYFQDSIPRLKPNEWEQLKSMQIPTLDERSRFFRNILIGANALLLLYLIFRLWALLPISPWLAIVDILIIGIDLVMLAVFRWRSPALALSFGLLVGVSIVTGVHLFRG